MTKVTLIPYRPNDPRLPALYAGPRHGMSDRLWKQLPRMLESGAGAGASAAGGGALGARYAMRFAARRWLVRRLPPAATNVAAAQQRREIEEGWSARFRTACEAVFPTGRDRLSDIARADPWRGSLVNGREQRRHIETGVLRILNEHDPSLLTEMSECSTAWGIRKALNDVGPEAITRQIMSTIRDTKLHAPSEQPDLLRSAAHTIRREFSSGLTSPDELEELFILLPRGYEREILETSRTLAETYLSHHFELLKYVALDTYNAEVKKLGVHPLVPVPVVDFTHREWRMALGWRSRWQRTAAKVPVLGKRWRD